MSSPKTFPGIYVSHDFASGISRPAHPRKVQSPAPPPKYDLGPVTEVQGGVT